MQEIETKEIIEKDKHFKTAIMNKCIDLLEIINSTDCLKFIILT